MGTKGKAGRLLEPDALKGLRLGISVSESPDLERLGLLETHFRLAVGELARTVLVSGGDLNYGGHLDAGGYTAFLIHELHRFSRRDRPFHSVLAWQEHRKLGTDQLRSQIKELGLYGDLSGLDPEGREIDVFANRAVEPVPEMDQAIIRKSLTSMRRFLTTKSHARIFIGGKRGGFQGDLPGVIEEAIFAVETQQPIYLAGGFGGVTADIAGLFGLISETWMPKFNDTAEVDPRWKKGLEILAETRSKIGDGSFQNGLTEEENRTLAISYRPSEVAALVSLGMGRKYATKHQLG